jgi:membrane-associated protease RseP (regulator of RpoE activity)
MMNIEESLLIISLFIILYALIIIILQKKGFLQKYNISFYGPALLLRTKKGIGFLSKIARINRFWRAFGSFGIFFCFIMMILMIYLLVLNISTVVNFSSEQIEALPGIEFGLVIPGVNPLLPLEYFAYIIIALIIAVIVHEFSHGILTFAHNLKVKSLGILYLIIPLGAFCEPDESELRKTKIKNRMCVYAAGPTSNFTLAFVMLLLFSGFFMASVQPIEGVHVLYVVPNSPAEEVEIEKGMVITSLNNTSVKSINDFLSVIQNTSVNQTIFISYISGNTKITRSIKLASQAEFSGNISHQNKSFLGVGFNQYIYGYINALKKPFTFAFPDGVILLYSLPFFSYLVGYNPIVAPFTQGYSITGVLGFLPPDFFWIIVNLLYWIFWLNLVVALFNVLPMIPLDGGFLFSDGLRSIIRKFNKKISEDKQEILVKNISLIISLLILISVLFPWIIKYL